MPYKLKITGITGAQDFLAQAKQEILETINEVAKRNVEFSIGGLAFQAKIDEKDLSNFYKKLPKLIKKAHSFAVKNLVGLLREALNDAMDNPVWNWNSGNRDIVDTGALKNSLKIFSDSDGDIHILYGEEYAGIVHYGGYFNPYGNPTIKEYYPARPWVDSVLKGGGPVPQFDFQAEYSALFTLELERLLG